MLEKLRDTADAILDLFAEYFELAENARKEGDTEQFQYWSYRMIDLTKEYHRILADIEKISKGVYVR